MNLTQKQWKKLYTTLALASLTIDQTKIIQELLRKKVDAVVRHNKRAFRPGMTVEFNSEKLGRRLRGEILRIRGKYTRVKCTDGNVWRVPTAWLEIPS